jgi:D-sedoheptulose 7-phosphate isomerase
MYYKYLMEILKESNQIRKKFINENWEKIINISNIIKESFTNGGKLLLIGNGGSAADCQHIAAEFINRFRRERKALPAIALTTDTSVITSIANDYSFDNIFKRQIEAFALLTDILFAISTSGKSKNIIYGVEAAKEKGIYTIGLTGGDGGDLAKVVDEVLIVDSKDVARIQEVHILVGHLICDFIDQLDIF